MKNKVAENPPVAVAKAYDFVLWLVQKVENFPRSHRFTIGERLAANGLDLLTLLVEASYARQKSELLEAASRKGKRDADATADGQGPEADVGGRLCV
ncbi:MAG: four helix bundle protein [Bryobacteraceae bacterium]|nr:four helix bundle protein [Bryobacteraceae bacterium]